MNDKITEVPNVERDKLIAATENLKRNMPALIEHTTIMAKLRYNAFLAHINAGFTPEQALQLCAKPFA